MRGRAALLIVALLAAGCSRRPRANPFDPANPTTHGRPVGFVALAGNRTVTLRWEPLASPDLLGYRLERREQGEAAFQVLAPLLSAGTSSYYDYGAPNGVRIDYRLSYVFGAGPSPDAASDYAIPGPLRPWVTDVGSGRLVRLTADGHHVAFTDGGFESPTGVAVDPFQGTVWASDSFTGVVVRYNPSNGDRIEIIGSTARPGAIAVDPLKHTAWVCDERQSAVLQFTLSGAPGSPAAVGPVGLPLDVAVDPQDGTLAVCDNQALRLLQFAPTGALRWSRAVPRPSRVAIDSLTRDAWATSFQSGVVVRVGFDGTVGDTVRVQGPIGVAVDARRGRVWVADALGGSIVTLDRSGAVERRITGFPEVREIAVDLDTGNAWATVPGDGRVVVVSPEGSLVAQLGGFVQPYAIALDPGSPLAVAARAGAHVDMLSP